MKPARISITAPTDLVRGMANTVPIRLEVKKPIKVRGIRALFHGAEETRAFYTTYNVATKTPITNSVIQHVDITRQEFILSGHEKLGLFGNIADGLATLFGGGQHHVLQPGDYDFEVKVELPQTAPSSFEGEKCRVFYELGVRVDIPLAIDVKSTHSFSVPSSQAPEPTSGPVVTRYPEDQSRGLLDAWFGPELKVEGGLADSRYRVGEEIEGIFRVQAPNSLECKTISLRLVGREQTEAEGYTDKHAHYGPVHVIAHPGIIGQSFEQEFRFPVQPAGPLTAHGKLFSIEWFVEIQLDVPWAKDPRIRIPIELVN